MNIETLHTVSYYVIKISGDLDASNSNDLDKEIRKVIELNEKSIVINCSNLDYVSSAGLGVFVSYLEEFKEKQIYFALSNVSERVLEILNILGLDKLINILDLNIYDG